MKRVILPLLFFGLIQGVFAQGVTTSSISGQVVDSDNQPLPGATVLAVHEPSGTQYGTATLVDGRYSLAGLRVGGPYSITVSFVGYETASVGGISLVLGATQNLAHVLSDSGTELGEIVIVADGSSVFNSDRTGAETLIDNDKLQTLPTISRGFNDFTRLTPQADIRGGAISIAGINNRYNQVTIDGVVSNDVFGLASSGTNGGQTGTSPISLDAIEEFQVVIAPYDVRYGGFAGGGISAVTRSGTNKFDGSVYYYFRNQNLAGVTPTNDENVERTKFDNFNDRQMGFRIGGPLIKDKLFFFINGETTSNVTPLSFEPGTGTSEITLAEVQQIEARALELGYDPGSYGKQESSNSSLKLFGRLDWNISKVHKLAFRYNYTFGEAVQLGRSQRALTFSNGAILRESTTNSSVLDLHSRFSNKVSNNLLIGYTTVREPRTAPGEPFPRATIRLDAQRTVALGTEAFSTVNQLDQNILTLTDNLTFYSGRNTITIGTHNEYYDIYNAFIGQAFGDYQFGVSPVDDINAGTGNPYTAIENWQRGLSNSFTYQYSKTPNPREGADFRALQLGFYVQNELQITQDLKVTGGIRLDIPIYLDDPLTNEDFNNSILAVEYNVQTDRMPKPAFMWSPRVGFNWDVNGDSRLQVRGGLGIFTSRFPFVWAGGAFTQNGILLDRNQIRISSDDPPTIDFVPDVNNQPKRSEESGPGGNITVMDENFKLPQIARFNIGVDKVFGDGWIATAELIVSRNLNAFRFNNINLAQPNEVASDGRALYPASGTRRLSNYTEVIYITNENEGGATSISAQLSKSFDSGFSGMLAYTYTRSTDLFPGTSSQNQSNYYRVASVNGSNNVQVGLAPFNAGSRIIGNFTYSKEYLRSLRTTISLFYTGLSGSSFSYIVSGDVNRGTFSSRNSNHFGLIYVPKDASEIAFVQDGDRSPQQQWNDFNAFIESQPHLRDRRGQFAERNGARTPFTHQFDLKIVQDIFKNIGSSNNTLQLTFDVFNFANLLNKNWGWRYTYGNSFFDNNSRVLNLAGFDGNTPQYTFRPIKDNEPWTVSDSPIGGSRWVGQVGIRYIFK